MRIHEVFQLVLRGLAMAAMGRCNSAQVRETVLQVLAEGPGSPRSQEDLPVEEYRSFKAIFPRHLYLLRLEWLVDMSEMC